MGKLFADPAFQKALHGGEPQEQNMVQSSSGTGMLAGGCTGEGITAVSANANDYMRATGLAYNSVLVATQAAGEDPGSVMRPQPGLRPCWDNRLTHSSRSALARTEPDPYPDAKELLRSFPVAAPPTGSEACVSGADARR
ncbi:hypothetical protein StoSoilB5_42060 [Arthrobacter sp. StoSoilB5]|nr:hypothetical protein StoSoilB5_42060 [Arthrobacter sp. StoSoilB5]